MQNELKNELHNILSGKSEVRFGAIIQAITCYLNNGEKTSSIIEINKHFKSQETTRLENYISKENLWIENIDFTQYVSEGAEQKVYLNDSEHVLKLNDAIYYSSWKDYFYNLLLHNYFFSDTAYELLGFTKDNETLYAVVKQNYVSITSNTDLSKVKTFLTLNSSAHNSSGHLPCKTLPFDGILFKTLIIKSSNIFLKSSNCIILSFLISIFNFSGLSVIFPPR